VLIGLVVVGIVGFIISRVLAGSKPQSVSTTPNASPGAAGSNRNTVPGQQTTLTYWGLWEPSEVLSDVLKKFEGENPGIKVEYVKQSPSDYRERLQTAIASGKGPDLFRFHASWSPMLKNELASVPTTVYSTADFKKTFYPAASDQLQVGGQLVGVPLMYDGLALYYNKDLLKSANAQPPTTWAELRTLATQLTIRSGDTVQRGGLAIGNASNVEHFADIIGLLMLQNGADLTKPTGAEARDALLFYTNFIKTDKVWSDTLPSSTVAFARGDVAMMFAPSWRAHEVKAQNPNLNFGIAPLPKLGETQITWATYWAEGVSAQSKNKDAAWKLIKYLSSAPAMKELYSSQSKVRSFGEPYSRVELASELASNELVAPYLSDAPAAKGWYLSSFTHDNGINDQLIKYYQDAINAILSGKDAEGVLQTLNQGTSQVLRQYGVSTTTTTSGTGTTSR
jgi:multiple sugar transport system substrate-binding protein